MLNSQWPDETAVVFARDTDQNETCTLFFEWMGKLFEQLNVPRSQSRESFSHSGFQSCSLLKHLSLFEKK